MDVQVSLAARQLIHALLNRDPATRLGSEGGSNAIKEHAFFRGINWPLIRCMVRILWFFCLWEILEVAISTTHLLIKWSIWAVFYLKRVK